MFSILQILTTTIQGKVSITHGLSQCSCSFLSDRWL